jgi:ATP-dependent DNA helicase RecG
LLLEEADLFLRRHLPVAGRIEAGVMERQDQPLYPPLALREALVNALCHRDYSIPGGAVNLAIFDDRLEIISAGLLPPGITVADLKREHVSRPRNPLIAEVFFRRGLIERWGRGTQKIVELCRTAGQPEPEFEEQAGSVVVRFRPGSYHPPLQVSRELSERQRHVLLTLSDRREWRVQEILAQLENPPSLRSLQADLRTMRELRLVQTSGRGRHARWWLTPPAE